MAEKSSTFETLKNTSQKITSIKIFIAKSQRHKTTIKCLLLLWCWVTVISVLALACLLIWCLLWCLLWCVFLLDALAIIYRSLFDEVAIHCLTGYA